jgi:hypothetical protein
MQQDRLKPERPHLAPKYRWRQVLFLGMCFLMVATTLVMGAEVNDDAGVPMRHRPVKHRAAAS